MRIIGEMNFLTLPKDTLDRKNQGITECTGRERIDRNKNKGERR